MAHKTCQRCGTELRPDVPGGFCPRCLVQAGIDLSTGAPLNADASPGDAAGTSAASPLATQHSTLATSFGDYELLEEIAHGGMGVVYKARQKSLDRIVALKLLLFGPHAPPESVKRFRAEAVATAALQHPNIVAIHEVGFCEGQHFLVMDFVEGPSLARLIGHQPLPAKWAAGCVKTIAEAIHYAHERGILHRDLKPSNVLMDAHDQPRVTDFGLAKRLLGDSELTVTGQVLGSPNYMPPEQATGKRGTLSRRSDVYALGAILYHAMTGRPPFVGEGLAETVQQVLNVEPVSPRVLNPSLPADLETVCLKCLEKEPGKRYATAQMLAEELGRFLEGKPVLARPVSRMAKVVRWCRRKPALATTIGLLLLVASVGLVSVLWQWRAAVTARAQSEHERYRAGISAAQTLIEHSQFDQARSILAREGVEAGRGWEWGWLQRLAHPDLMRLDHNTAVTDLAFRPDERYLLTGSLDGAVRLWELATGRLVHLLQLHTGQVDSVTFSADGAQFLTASSDGTARIFNTDSSEQKLVIRDTGALTKAAFGPATSFCSNVVVTAGVSGGLKLWELGSGALLGIEAADEQIQTFDFSPDGQKLAFAERSKSYAYNTDYRVTILDLKSKQRRSFKAHRFGIKAVRYNRQGTLLATASADGTARLWNAVSGEEAQPLQTSFRRAQFFDVDFSPDGRWLAASEIGPQMAEAHIFEVATGRRIRSVAGHSLGVARTAFSPSGKRFATAGYDAAVCLWSAETPREFLSLEGHDQAVWTVAFSPDGKRLASGGFDLKARLWDTDTGSLLTTIPVGFHVLSLAFNPDGSRLVTVATNNTAMVWTTNGEPCLHLSGHGAVVMAVAWSRTGQQLLTGSQDGTARLWDATSGVLIQTVPAHSNGVLSVAFSPDARLFATGGQDSTVRVWEGRTGRLLHALKGHKGWVQAVGFSPDGRRLATGCEDQKVRLFDSDNGRLLLVMEGHRAGITSLAFCPDGTHLATAAAGPHPGELWTFDHAAIIWDLRRGQHLLKLDAHQASLMSVAFSPDGRRLATSSSDNTIRIREAFPWKTEDLARPIGFPLGQRVEIFKRRYWQQRLASGAWTVPMGETFLQPGRRSLTLYGIDYNLAAKRGTKIWPMGPIPQRAPHADSALIDLSTVYNVALGEVQQPIFDLSQINLRVAPASLSAGIHSWDGVAFDVRGVIHLGRAAFGFEVFPTEVEVAVGRKFHRLHVLHGARISSRNDVQIGAYRLHYRDGRSEAMPIIYGRDVLDFNRTSADLPQAKVVAFSWNKHGDLSEPRDSQSRWYFRTYENRAPDSEVVSITFESTLSTSAPLLLAMTVEP